jgi:hypothetical protein
MNRYKIFALNLVFLCFMCGAILGRESVTDNTDLPFVNDPAVIGRWESGDFVPAVSSLTPPTAPEEDPLRRNLPRGIHRHPRGAAFKRGSLAELPRFNPRDHSNPFPVDLRGYDLRSLNLAGREGDLLRSDFDDRTQWPAVLPEGFDLHKILETGKNPGLGVRALHQQGITGRGVGVAILDQALLVEHVEYQDRLRHYEEIHWPSERSPQAQMHGPAVASIACGRTVGVAPEADLYYIAKQNGDSRGGKFDWDFHWLALSIDRVLQINRQLPPEKRIRVISVSVGWAPSQKGYEEVMAATRRASEQGVFVISSSLDSTHGLKLRGLGRDPLADPDQPGSYLPGFFWQEYFLRKPALYGGGSVLLVPMDARTTASPTGASEYVHYDIGGMSWAVPYLAGLYALACQVNPAVTPDQFWKTALETGDTIDCRLEGKAYRLGRIVNPARLMERMKKAEETSAGK